MSQMDPYCLVVLLSSRQCESTIPAILLICKTFILTARARSRMLLKHLFSPSEEGNLPLKKGTVLRYLIRETVDCVTYEIIRGAFNLSYTPKTNFRAVCSTKEATVVGSNPSLAY